MHIFVGKTKKKETWTGFKDIYPLPQVNLFILGNKMANTLEMSSFLKYR